MEISQITNTGTSMNPIISAVIDNITFNNIPSGSKGTKGVAFWNQSSNAQVWKDNGDGTKWKPSVNAVDIDWNGAQVNDDTINTTGELLSKIKNIENSISTVTPTVEALDLVWGDDNNPVTINGDRISSTDDLIAKIADLETLVRGLYASLEINNDN